MINKMVWVALIAISLLGLAQLVQFTPAMFLDGLAVFLMVAVGSGLANNLPSPGDNMSRSARNPVPLSRSAFRDRFHIMGEAGSGKSRFMGRRLCWFLLKEGWPQIILDPTSGTVLNALDVISRLFYAEDRIEAFKRLIYVDMSGKSGYVVPFPLYHRLVPDEPLFDVSQRFIEVLRRMDPRLSSAPIMGLNALITIGTYAGMLLTTLGFQITEAVDLIRNPEAWEGRFERALSIDPDVREAVAFFRAFADNVSSRDQMSRTFLTKIMPFITEPTTRAMFGAAEPGFRLDEVIRQRKTILFDFSQERNPERLRFKLLWIFRLLIDYAKLRGFAGRDQPFGLIIDEFTQLL